VIAIAAVVWMMASSQDPEEPRRARTVRFQNDVRIIIEETPKEEFEHDYYEQQLPVEVRSGTPSVSSGVWYRTICRPQEDDSRPIFLRPPAMTTLPLSIAAG